MGDDPIREGPIRGGFGLSRGTERLIKDVARISFSRLILEHSATMLRGFEDRSPDAHAAMQCVEAAIEHLKRAEDDL